MERDRIVYDYKTFEGMKTTGYKKLHNWSGKISGNYENEIQASKLIIEKTKDTPLLDWLNGKGYGVVGFEGLNREGSLDHLGQYGIPHTFYLIESWNKGSYIDYIENSEGVMEDDLRKVFSLFGMDLDTLDIYGLSRSVEYTINIDGSYIDISQILDYYDENKDNWDTLKKEVVISSEEIDYSRTDKFPFWASKVPIRFHSQPSRDSHEYRVMCEIGLKMVQFEILKFMKTFNLNSYYDLKNKGVLDSNIYRGDIKFLIEYMNLSGVHISKNEDLEIVYEVYYNMYLGSKLFYENHENVEFKLDPRLVDEFIKQKNN